MSTKDLRRTIVLLGSCLLGCLGEPAPDRRAEESDHVGPPLLVVPDEGPVAALSVAAMDRPTSELVPLDGSWPVEARMLVLSANGQESELGAIVSVLGHRGVPYDVFVATDEPPLLASRLRSGARGFYQAIILTSSSLAV
ncbi:MAG TPA: hypothetical protein VIG06_26870, partial [Kofleriaceae bacterium]